MVSGATFLKPEILALVEDAARKHGLDFWMLVAQVEKESSGNPNAIRLEATYRWFFPRGSTPEGDELEFQRTSWGLLQIMGATARELGYAEPATPWPSSPLKNDPAAALDLGCAYLVRMWRRWGPSWRDALSAYNAGHPTPENFGAYVEPILERADALKESVG
jgi:soluble lytic murein transglycosylase-like protein